MALRLQRPDEQPQLRLAQPRVAQTISIRQARPAPAQTVPTRQIQPAQSVQRTAMPQMQQQFRVPMVNPQMVQSPISLPRVQSTPKPPTRNFLQRFTDNVIIDGGSQTLDAARGAAYGLMDFVPRSVGNTYKSFGNTVKRFDNDNQFADQLIESGDRMLESGRRTNADVLKLGGDSIGHEFGQAGSRLITDAALALAPTPFGKAQGVVTTGSNLNKARQLLGGGSLIPMAGHFSEVQNQSIDRMQQAGKEFNESYDWSAANAGAQAALEKVGIDKFTGPMGKNAVGRFISRAASEGLQEGAQQLTDNAFARAYDPTQGLWEGVAKSGLMGAAIGGPAGLVMDNSPRAADATKKGGKAVIKGTQRAADNLYGGMNERGLQAELERNELLAARNNMQRAFDVETDPVRRRQINQGLAQINRQLQESGFVAGPLALDFSNAQKQGLVFDGVDGKPRFEVDDSGAKLNDKEFSWGIKMDGKPRKVGQILEHDKLFEQYPELKDVNVRYEPNDLPGHDAHFDPDTNTIVITKSRADKSHLSDIVHELQHSIQEREGFAGGGAPEYRNYKAENASIKRGLQDVNTTLSGKNLTPEQTQRLRAKRDNLIKQLEQTQDQYGSVFTKAKDIAEYRRLAGEAEARAVQARMNMPMSERYVTPKTKAADYVGSHQAPTRGDGDYHAPASDVTGGAGMFPDDIYTDPMAYRYYGHGGDAKTIAMDKKSIELIKSIKGNPDAEVTMYRAVPKGKADKINPGDWVTLNKDYAQLHNNSQFDGKGTILEKKVRADELYTDGNSIHEFGYDPKAKPQSTFYDSLDVPKQDLIIKNGDGKAMSVESKKTPKQYKDAKMQAEADYQASQTKAFTPDERLALQQLSEEYVQKIKSADITEAKQLKKEYDKLISEKFDGKQWTDAENNIDYAIQDAYDAVRKQAKPTLQTALEGKSTKVEPKENMGASVPFMITRDMRQQLSDLGHSKQAIDKMNPTRAWEVINGGETATRQAPTSDQSNTKLQDKQVKSTAQKVQQTPTSDTPVLVQPKKVTGQSPATQTSTKGDVSSANNTTKSKFTKEQLEAWDNANLEADRKNTAVTYGKKKKTDMLTDAIERSAKINKAAKQAVDTGKELHFYAKTDDNGRSVGIERFNPDKTKIEAGFVVDSYGKIIGNHIKVDNTGVQVNIGGELVNIEKVIGNPLEWKGKYRVSETMSRNIDRNAPSKEIADKTKSFLITSKYKAEARFRTELHNEYKNLSDRIKATKDAKPRGVDMKTYQDDIFSVLNGDTTLSDIKGMYPTETYTAIKDYHDTTRSLYDTLLERVNNERVKFGQQPIEKRQNYITHLQELSNNKDFVGDAFTTMKNSFLDDMNMKTRGGVPGEIAGRTENFKPISAYNRFLQRRTGEASLRDPFQAVQEYLEPALYNIHMTETTARARAIESAFRTADQIKRMQPDQVTKNTSDMIKHYRRKGDTSKLITGFQEYANALGRKTQRWDRQVIDSSDAMGKSIRGWQYLQRRGGQATIIGNVSSVMMQPLNQVVTLADAGPKNYLRGIVANVAGDTAIDKSAFIKARATQVNKPIRGVGGKILDVGGMPLQEVEMAAVKQTWHAMHTKAKADGYKGQQAIDKADLDTERLVAGRGIADRPELYRSSIANGFLQFTLEVNAQYKAFTQDLNVGQKATFMVAAMALNELYENINGQTPLPDFLTPVIEAMLGLADDEDDKSAGQELAEMTQKLFGEAVSMNPVSSSIASAALTQEQREQVFGEDANVARFEGTAAPIQLVRNVYDAGKAAVEGDWKTARDKGLKTVPYGNQAQKTIRGAEANRDGYVASPSGRVMFETGTNPVDATKNLLFGPYSTKNSVNFFNSKASPFGEKQSETIRSLSGAARTEYMDTIRKLREAGLKATESNIQKASSGTSLEALKTPKKADTGWMDEYKAAKSSYEKESKNWSTVERAKKEKELAKLEVKKHFSKDVTSLYGMAERDIYGLLDSLDEKEANKYLTQAVAYADKMVEAGLWTTNKLRDKNGNVQYDRNYNAKQAAGGSRSTSRTSSRTSTRKTSTRKSSGTRSAKGKFDYKLFGFMPKSRDTSSELYDLLKKAKMKSTA